MKGFPDLMLSTRFFTLMSGGDSSYGWCIQVVRHCVSEDKLGEPQSQILKSKFSLSLNFPRGMVVPVFHHNTKFPGRRRI